MQGQQGTEIKDYLFGFCLGVGVFSLVWIMGGLALLMSMLSLKSLVDQIIGSALFLLYVVVSPGVVAILMASIGACITLSGFIPLGATLILASKAPYAVFRLIMKVFRTRSPAWLAVPSLCWSGAILNDLGRFVQAQKLTEKSILEVEEDFGKGSNIWLDLQLNLAETFIRMGQFSEAERRIAESLQYQSRKAQTFFEIIPRCNIYRRWAQLCAAQEKYLESEEHYKEAINSLAVNNRESVQTLAELTGDIAIELAAMYCRSAMPERAAELAIKAKKQKKTDMSKIFLYKWHYVMGMVALRAGGLTEAEDHLNLALKYAKKFARIERLEIADITEGMASLCQARSELDKADLLFHDTLAMTVDYLGPDHPRVARIYRVYREFLLQCGKEQKSDELARQFQLTKSASSVNSINP
jgi:tetratricopeptide (TPR) repeat protein